MEERLESFYFGSIVGLRFLRDLISWSRLATDSVRFNTRNARTLVHTCIDGTYWSRQSYRTGTIPNYIDLASSEC